LIGGGTPSKEKSEYWEEGTIPWVSPKDMKRQVIFKTEDYVTENAVHESAASFVAPGSPLMVVRSGILRHSIPVALAGCRLTLNQDMKAFCLNRKIDARFFIYWVEGQSDDLLLEWRQLGATVESINTDWMLNCKCALPNAETQKAIAAFLDHETARIDQWIEKKTRFIALLKEKRVAVIAHAVTKGIDPYVPTKDSGVDWLGKIPAHWQIVPPTALFIESKERAREGDQLLSATQKYGVIPLAEYEELEQRQVTLAVTNLEMRKHVEIGDFVISMRSMDGGLERAHAIGSVRSSYSVLKPGPNVEGRFYGALLKSSLYIQALRLTSNFIRDGQDMNFSHFRKVRLPKLDVREQAAIADHIEAEVTRIDSLITLTERSIERLREFRAALITAAVTGQIDAKKSLPNVSTKPNRERFRVIVGAEIVHRHRNVRRFGRVKFQKLLYLAEVHAGIHELDGSYLREAAGPFDGALIADTERGLEAARFFRAVQPSGGGEGPVSYQPLEKAGQHDRELRDMLGPRLDKLSRLIDLLKGFKRLDVEAITTLFAVWNDALIDGHGLNDDGIIEAVLTEWHPEKTEKFDVKYLRHWLDWMKRNGLVPIGSGPKTKLGRLFP
jgi:type I restriction enzyme S subunit